ncbi:MAG: hypothetical protein KDK25_08655 [Leptospiraceae bacterium]|nr:hypothetical protein [Leptospiraceae bacterium]MCB1169388.1 hypothetical protein [Leptospiraceae bacterium]MCB1170390.1 hypothetical protein [Leptospiraceae bacterium]
MALDKKLLTLLLLGALALQSSHALPPMEPPMDRAKKSTVILHAQIKSSQEERLNSVAHSAQLGIQVLGVLKAPSNFDATRIRALHFLVFPQSFESGMREPPGPGEWIIFLNLRTVDTGERKVVVPVLYDPPVFAFHPYDAILAEKIQKLP